MPSTTGCFHIPSSLPHRFIVNPLLSCLKLDLTITHLTHVGRFPIWILSRISAVVTFFGFSQSEESDSFNTSHYTTNACTFSHNFVFSNCEIQCYKFPLNECCFNAEVECLLWGGTELVQSVELSSGSLCFPESGHGLKGNPLETDQVFGYLKMPSVNLFYYSLSWWCEAPLLPITFTFCLQTTNAGQCMPCKQLFFLWLLISR
jgi:hypothetical protein